MRTKHLPRFIDNICVMNNSNGSPAVGRAVPDAASRLRGKPRIENPKSQMPRHASPLHPMRVHGTVSPLTMAAPLVVENVTKTFKQGDRTVTALDGVSLSVERARFLAIMG